MSGLTKNEIASWFRELQDDICTQLEALEPGSRFLEENWERPEGGGGRTRVLQQKNTIEKGGVNFSAVEGPTPNKIIEALKIPQADFFATGVSIVLHPKSPMVPIIHMNVRYFEMDNGIWWFGGGIDLTPHYVVDEDAQFFHSALKKTCDQHNLNYYPKFKQWADDYFFIKHRNETRGIGGIFFDRLNQDHGAKENLFKFVQDVGKTFAPTYCDLVRKNQALPYTENELDWQALRRSRYVEFNLVLDKGTKFGLDTNGRTESILMSMPPMAKWEYNHTPAVGSKEAQTLTKLVKGIDWV